jgi:hypothetical protein
MSARCWIGRLLLSEQSTKYPDPKDLQHSNAVLSTVRGGGMSATAPSPQSWGRPPAVQPSERFWIVDYCNPGSRCETQTSSGNESIVESSGTLRNLLCDTFCSLESRRLRRGSASVVFKSQEIFILIRSIRIR